MRVKRLAGLLAWAIASALFCASLWVHFAQGNAGDKDMRLWVTHLWLEGRALYSGVYIDVNPPLSIWLYSIPVRLAQVLSLTDYHVLVLFGLCFVAYAIFIAQKLIAFHPQFQDSGRHRAFIVLLAFLCVYYPSPAWFFEREHIFWVLTLPYLLRWMPSLCGAPIPKALRVQTGLLAALGFLIKPHCIVPFVGIQLLFILMQKSLRILVSVENLIIYVAGITYGCCVWFIVPAYFTTMLPMAMATYRALINYMDGRIFSMILALVTFALIVVDFRPRYRSPYRRDIYYLLGITPFLAAYILVNNGWTTTYYPLMSLLLLLAGMMRWEALWLKEDYAAKGLPVRNFTFAARACSAALFLNALQTLPIIYKNVTFNCEDHIECRVDNQLLKEVQGPQGLRSFGTMSSVYGRWIELSRNSGAKLQTRFHQLWMLPRFVTATPDFYRAQEWILRYIAEAYAQDITRYRPDIMFVDDYDLLQRDGKPVFMPVFFSSYPAFRDAWASYRFDHTVDYCPPYYGPNAGCRFDVYRRTR